MILKCMGRNLTCSWFVVFSNSLNISFFLQYTLKVNYRHGYFRWTFCVSRIVSHRKIFTVIMRTLDIIKIYINNSPNSVTNCMHHVNWKFFLSGMILHDIAIRKYVVYNRDLDAEKKKFSKERVFSFENQKKSFLIQSDNVSFFFFFSS